jgi:pyrimidine operon attenuation protein/uracil phosphoribosyltransferase
MAGSQPTQPQPEAAPGGGRFAFRARVFDADALRRATIRIAHEIVERNRGATDVVLVGLPRRGPEIARRIAEAIRSFEGVEVPVGTLDVTMHRDDLALRPVRPLGPTRLPTDIGDRVVVLVDDVLFTGRTVRAALDALGTFGRPRAVQLAVLVDRGHRELPIRADFVGKNLPTKRVEDVRVRLTDTDGVAEDAIELWAPADDRRRPDGGAGP